MLVRTRGVSSGHAVSAVLMWGTVYTGCDSKQSTAPALACSGYIAWLRPQKL
jgi:hypothetical protein